MLPYYVELWYHRIQPLLFLVTAGAAIASPAHLQPWASDVSAYIAPLTTLPGQYQGQECPAWDRRSGCGNFEAVDVSSGAILGLQIILVAPIWGHYCLQQLGAVEEIDSLAGLLRCTRGPRAAAVFKERCGLIIRTGWVAECQDGKTTACQLSQTGQARNIPPGGFLFRSLACLSLLSVSGAVDLGGAGPRQAPDPVPGICGAQTPRVRSHLLVRPASFPLPVHIVPCCEYAH